MAFNGHGKFSGQDVVPHVWDCLSSGFDISMGGVCYGELLVRFVSLPRSDLTVVMACGKIYEDLISLWGGSPERVELSPSAS